ncbi:restriction endonuclease subunit S [uncultured Fibrobacter sp.]|uniref:restriction endonuclease subunit S n=1 Tax=uncultured Fibrobacter sp. TaxID=261512 RepID=UPI00260A80B6|nr:restriction endonuclease subunit S [uncultured Fibrobacter sp.]
MGLSNLATYKLGDLIELSDDRNSDGVYGIDDVKGISIKKVFIETKADMSGVSLTPYILVKPDYFAYVTVTSRNGEKITLAHNTSQNTYIVSSSYIVFRIKKPELLLSKYLFMYFNRAEFDRYSRFNSWGSARETFSWQDMCDISIMLPDVPTQQKYVNIYDAMCANQKAYEKGLDDLKLTCDAYIEELRRKMPCEKIGLYISQSDKKNESGKLTVDDVKGISIQKEFIETKADMTGVSLNPYLQVSRNSFAYVPVTSRNGDKITIALNSTNDTYLVSSSYIVFRPKDDSKLDSDYLMLFFVRSEFDRYARFNSWGSARETFDWNALCDYKIPIPDITTQKNIAEIYKAFNIRKNLNEKLKQQIKNICPILIKGAIEEGKSKRG